MNHCEGTPHYILQMHEDPQVVSALPVSCVTQTARRCAGWRRQAGRGWSGPGEGSKETGEETGLALGPGEGTWASPTGSQGLMVSGFLGRFAKMSRKTTHLSLLEGKDYQGSF